MNTEENKRMLAISYMVADLKAENMELEQRLHQLEDDYADVFHQLNDKVLRKDEATSKHTQDEMQHLRDHCDMLEKNIEQLKRDCIQLQIERNEARTRADQCDIIQEDLSKHIARFDNSEFLKTGDACPHRDSLPNGNHVKVGSEVCSFCPHMIKEDVSGKKCVLCAYCYDNKKAEEAQKCKPTDD